MYVIGFFNIEYDYCSLHGKMQIRLRLWRMENTPPHYWWIIVAAMAAITSVVNITFVKLQSKDLLVSQQLEELGVLSARIYSDVVVECPYDLEDAEDTGLA